MYAIVIASLEANLTIQTKEFGCCNNWKNFRNNDYPIIHYPSKMFDKNDNCIWFKQNFTQFTLRKPWKLETKPNQTTNKIEYQLIQNIQELVNLQHLERNTQMLYWNNKELDNSLKYYNPSNKYISFEPWPGGFNNIRMSLELAASVAYLLNRKLILPNKYKMYLLENKTDFSQFFDQKLLVSNIFH